MAIRPVRKLGGALGALGVLAVVVAGCGGDDDGSSASVSADDGIDGVEIVRVESNAHTEAPVDYDLRPPAGGPHHPVWLNCGFYTEAHPDEHVVHTLEHGAVWLAYSPDLSDDDVAQVRDLVEANDKVVATPYAELPEGVAVVASAWARQLQVTDVGDARLQAFIDEFEGGSQAPEGGVTCRGSPLG